MIRELNSSIRALDDAEQLRRETESAMTRKKYGSGLSALSSWASGGGALSKTAEHLAAEAQAQQVEIHRDGILWFLRQRLEVCCRVQQAMMETRLAREMEKTRGMLGPPMSDFADFSLALEKGRTLPDSLPDMISSTEGLTDEQVQLFEESNQDMMKHYESTLDQVRYVLQGARREGKESADLSTESLRNPSSRSRSSSLCWLITCPRSQHTSSSLFPTPCLRLIMLAGATRS